MKEVILGLIAIAIAGLAGWLHRSRVTPAMTRFINRGMNLTDTWEIKRTDVRDDGIPEKTRWRTVASIRQFGSSIKGTANATSSNGTTSSLVRFKITGVFCNNTLHLLLTDVSRSRGNISCFLLQPVGDGSAMEGHRLYLARRTNSVHSVPCRWERLSTSSDCEA